MVGGVRFGLLGLLTLVMLVMGFELFEWFMLFRLVGSWDGVVDWLIMPWLDVFGMLLFQFEPVDTKRVRYFCTP